MGRGANTDSQAQATINMLRENPGRRGRIWTDENIKASLQILSDQLGRFPTDQELHDYGLGGVRKRIRDKGLEYWGRQVGYSVRAQGEQLPEQLAAKSIWTDEKIEQCLRELHTGRTDMMSRDEFRASKYPGIESVVYSKGVHYWAEKLGLQTKTENWNEETITEALNQLLLDCEHFPSQNQFKAAGQEKLLAAMRRHKGVDYWVKKTGLSRARAGSPGTRGKQMKWSDELIAQRLAKFLEEFDYFPSQREFKQTGMTKLLWAMQRHRGVSYWAAKSGLPRAPSTPAYAR